MRARQALNSHKQAVASDGLSSGPRLKLHIKQWPLHSRPPHLQQCTRGQKVPTTLTQSKLDLADIEDEAWVLWIHRTHQGLLLLQLSLLRQHRPGRRLPHEAIVLKPYLSPRQMLADRLATTGLTAQVAILRLVQTLLAGL
jgi:hypothetical protein